MSYLVSHIWHIKKMSQMTLYDGYVVPMDMLHYS